MGILNRNYRFLSLILAGIGALVSLYLSYVKITHQEAFCGGSGECATVANSPYSEISGIPVAFLGLGAYLVIMGILLLEKRTEFLAQNGPVLIFGLTLTGTIYSAYLTYLEVAVIHAICPYCVVSAIVMTLLFLIAIVRMTLPAEGRVVKFGDSTR